MRIAAILARVSRETQETESQISALKQCAYDFGFDVPSELIFQEKITGMDSFDRDERESLRNLKTAIESRNDIEAVFMWELTRLSRNPYYLIDQLRWFNSHQIPIHIYDNGWWTRDINTNQEILETTNHIFGAATYGINEWKKIKERTKRGRDLKARKGLFVGHIADGYKVVLDCNEKHFAVDEERASVIRKVFDLYVNEGFSSNQIAAEFNDNGIPTFNALEAMKNKDNSRFLQTYKKRGTAIRVEKTQTKWTGSTVTQILHNRWYIGERKYLGETYSVPAIISKETFNMAQMLTEKNRSETTKKTSATYPLKSLLICGKCGRFMYGHRSGVNTSYYCSSVETGTKCGMEGIAKQNADWIAWDLIAGNAIAAYARHEDIRDLKEVLGYDKINIAELEEKISALNEKIEKKQKTIGTSRRQIAQCTIELSTCGDEMREYYQEIKNQTARNLEMAEKELKNMLNERSNFQIIIEKSESVDDAIVSQIQNIMDNKDIVSAAKIIRLYVKVITLYSIERYYKFLDMELYSGVHKYALYNYRKFKGHYYILPFPSLKYDGSQNQFAVDRPYFSRELLKHFEGKSESQIKNEFGLNNNQLFLLMQGKTPSEQIENRLNDIFGGNGLLKPNTPFTIDQLVEWLKQNEEPLPLKSLETEPDTDFYRKWKEQSKLWYKERNRRKLEERKKRRDTLNQQHEGYRTRIQIAHELGVAKLSVWRDIRQKVLPATKVNGIWMVSPEDFETYKLYRCSNG